MTSTLTPKQHEALLVLRTGVDVPLNTRTVMSLLRRGYLATWNTVTEAGLDASQGKLEELVQFASRQVRHLVCCAFENVGESGEDLFGDTVEQRITGQVWFFVDDLRVYADVPTMAEAELEVARHFARQVIEADVRTMLSLDEDAFEDAFDASEGRVSIWANAAWRMAQPKPCTASLPGSFGAAPNLPVACTAPANFVFSGALPCQMYQIVKAAADQFGTGCRGTGPVPCRQDVYTVTEARHGDPLLEAKGLNCFQRYPERTSWVETETRCWVDGTVATFRRNCGRWSTEVSVGEWEPPTPTNPCTGVPCVDGGAA